MEQNDLVESVELGLGRKVPPPTDIEVLREHLRSAYVDAYTTMTDIAQRTGLPRSEVVSVLGLGQREFPDHDLFMTVAADLVEERYLAAWSACWQTAYDSRTVSTDQTDDSDVVELGLGWKQKRPTDVYTLNGLLRAAFVSSGTTMTDIAERTGLRRAAVASVLGFERYAVFPDYELFMAIAGDLVEERYLAAWSACWQTAYDSPNRMLHPPV
ncbi:hypothetical protein [Nocardia farcinica]|uniref:hypothetical protein n=1 Tax=Nocardia farcinica TaxID=37329 RepID=UPI00189342C9|nr:hypothetical protein [Nocardia farcinica]MBF6445555.1 hypothetical protein [Nocardia farcinica]